MIFINHNLLRYDHNKGFSRGIKIVKIKGVVGLASLGQLKYTLELDKKIIAKMKFIEGVGLKNDIGQDLARSIEVFFFFLFFNTR